MTTSPGKRTRSLNFCLRCRKIQKFKISWKWSTNSSSLAVDAYEESVNWFTKAAGNGLDRAQNELANRYYHGEGVDKNLTETERWEKAVEWYTKAADQNYAPAQNALADMYVEKKGIDKKNLTETERWEKAVEWYTKAADPKKGKDANAQFNLAQMYKEGKGVDENLTETERWEKAVEWYTWAADQDNAAAQNNLATMYSKGKGVSKNSEKAARLHFSAAQQGYLVAQANIGRNFEDGADGFSQDNAEAYYWYSLALKDPVKLDKLSVTKNFADKVAKWREGIEDNLPQEKKDKIQERVNNWKSRILYATGTGFYVDKKHILTNAHVVTWKDRDGNKRKFDELHIGYRYVEEKPGTKSVDHDVDLALLFDESGNKHTAIFTETSVQVADEVHSFGYPKAFQLSYDGNFTSGSVSGMSDTINVPQPDNRFQHTAPIQRGNSGGPVFDNEGNVVGVSVSGLTDTYFDEKTGQYLNLAQNINFAIKFNIIKAFLKKNKIIPKTIGRIDNVEDPISSSRRKKILQKAHKFTLPILCFKNKSIELLPLVRMDIDYWKR